MSLFSCGLSVGLATMSFSLLLVVGEGQAADSVTVISIDQDKGAVTVRDNATGATKQVRIDDAEALKSFKVGEVLEKPASLDAQSRAAQSPPTQAPAASAYTRCRAAGGTAAQCLHWTATRG